MSIFYFYRDNGFGERLNIIAAKTSRPEAFVEALENIDCMHYGFMADIEASRAAKR